MSLGFVEGPRRDFDGPFWIFYPMDGTHRKYPRLDPLACEALIQYLEPWMDAGMARKAWTILTEEYGSDVYTVQVAAVFAVAVQSLKSHGVPAKYGASREGATMWLGHQNVEPNLTISWDPRQVCFNVMRKMP
jgi:hypothetical protein